MSPPINSATIRRAIERIQPELSDLFRINHLRLIEELDSLTDNRLLVLCGCSASADKHLQNGLNYFIGGHELFGDPLAHPPHSIRFRCPVGPHFVYQAEVLQHDVYGRPLCPRHRKPMNKEP